MDEPLDAEKILQTGMTTQWIGDADIVGQLEKTSTGWTCRESDDAVETYDAAAK